MALSKLHTGFGGYGCSLGWEKLEISEPVFTVPFSLMFWSYHTLYQSYKRNKQLMLGDTLRKKSALVNDPLGLYSNPPLGALLRWRGNRFTITAVYRSRLTQWSEVKECRRYFHTLWRGPTADMTLATGIANCLSPYCSPHGVSVSKKGLIFPTPLRLVL